MISDENMVVTDSYLRYGMCLTLGLETALKIPYLILVLICLDKQ